MNDYRIYIVIVFCTFAALEMLSGRFLHRSETKSKDIILEGEGSHFDPQVVQAFLAIEDLFVEIAATYKDGKSVENELERESLIASTA